MRSSSTTTIKRDRSLESHLTTIEVIWEIAVIKVKMRKIKMKLSNNKSSIRSTWWRDNAIKLSRQTRNSSMMKDKLEWRKKKSSSFKDSSQFPMKFSLRFLRRAFTKKPEIRWRMNKLKMMMKPKKRLKKIIFFQFLKSSVLKIKVSLMRKQLFMLRMRHLRTSKIDSSPELKLFKEDSRRNRRS